MRVFVGAFAGLALLAGTVAARPAEARCFWNGYAWECWHHPAHSNSRWRHYEERTWPAPVWFWGWQPY